MSEVSKLTPVVSSNLQAIGHVASANLLTVEFKNGKRYEYQNVTADLHAQIMGAESVGSTFNKLVKSQPANFPFTEVAA